MCRAARWAESPTGKGRCPPRKVRGSRMRILVVRREQEQERGAVMVLTALIMSVLAIFAGGTMAAVTLYGANQEGRRAADLDALSAAASLPTANLTACNTDICNPVHLPTGNQFCPPPNQGILKTCSSLGT